MRHKSILALAFAAARVLYSGGAAADAWVVDPSQSTLAFEIAIGGTMARGSFGAWQAAIDFDPTAPDSGQVEVAIDTGSVSISDPRAASSIGKAEWLDISAFPSAGFAASGFAVTPAGDFTLAGTLTLLGLSRPVELSGQLVIENDVATASATARFDRETFGIGLGQSAIGQEVRVMIDLVAKRAE